MEQPTESYVSILKDVVAKIVGSCFEYGYKNKKVIIIKNADPYPIRAVSRALKIKANKLEKKILICDYEPLMKIAEPENGELLVIRDPKGDLERDYELWEKTYCIDMSWVFKDFHKNHR